MADETKILESISQEARERGLNAVAKELGIPRQTLGSVLCGCGRDGTNHLVVSRWRAREFNREARTG